MGNHVLALVAKRNKNEKGWRKVNLCRQACYSGPWQQAMCCIDQWWPARGSPAACGSLPSFMRLLRNYQKVHWITCVTVNGW